MTLNLSIKNVPDHVVEQLRERARRHHRSLQGELMAILEDATESRRMTVKTLRERVRELGLRTGAEAVAMVREDRDAR